MFFTGNQTTSTPSRCVATLIFINNQNELTFEQLTLVEYYQKRREELIEDNELVVIGEDDSFDEGEKPIRLLSDFSIFDPKQRNEFVSLAAIEEDDGVDRQFEAAGMVMPYFVNEEDEGQDEETDVEPQYIRLSAVLRYTVDYAKESEYAISFLYDNFI